VILHIQKPSGKMSNVYWKQLGPSCC